MGLNMTADGRTVSKGEQLRCQPAFLSVSQKGAFIFDLRVGAEAVRHFAQDRRKARGVPRFDIELVEP